MEKKKANAREEQIRTKGPFDFFLKATVRTVRLGFFLGFLFFKPSCKKMVCEKWTKRAGWDQKMGQYFLLKFERKKGKLLFFRGDSNFLSSVCFALRIETTPRYFSHTVIPPLIRQRRWWLGR